MTFLLFIWIGLLAALVVWAIRKPGEGGTLTLAYFLVLSLIHVPGALIFVDPFAAVPGAGASLVGFQMTVIGLTAFVSGAILSRSWNRLPFANTNSVQAVQPKSFEGIGWTIFLTGVASYFVLLPLATLIPSLTSIVAALGTSIVVGLWLRLYGAALTGDRHRTLTTLAILPLLPIATLVNGGFIGFGVCWAISAVAFLFVITHRKRWFFVSAPFVIFFSLSLFVTYMGQRTGIRDLFWNQHAGIVERLDRISTLVTQFQVLDLADQDHIAALNDRLNQNYFVGTGILRHESGAVDLLHGATVSPLALIPRAVWADKPAVGGGGDVVSLFTGISLSRTSSFGVGQVLEFYMDFGLPGVIGGFFILGFILRWLDFGIARALAAGNMRGFLTRSMIGVSMLQPGGNLVEVMVAVVASFLAANLLFTFVLMRRGQQGGAHMRDAAQFAPDPNRAYRSPNT